MSVQLFTA